MTPEERFARIEANLDRTTARLDRMAAEQQEWRKQSHDDQQRWREQSRNEQDEWRKEHREAMSEIYSIVTQIGQQTLVLGQRLTELINAMRRGERNGQS
jgi:thiamine pyrophosphate-dependent acetolactate synthase large subunit-like protein